MQLHKIWHINANGNAHLTEFYATGNGGVDNGMCTFVNEDTKRSFSVPVEKILFIESEVL
jgi:hypothetical protein